MNRDGWCLGHVLYDDFRFVTQDQLADVGLSHLIGTDLIKAYMHGYFIHNKLYSKCCTHPRVFVSGMTNL